MNHMLRVTFVLNMFVNISIYHYNLTMVAFLFHEFTMPRVLQECGIEIIKLFPFKIPSQGSNLFKVLAHFQMVNTFYL